MKQLQIDFIIKTLEDFHFGTGLSNTGLYNDGQYKDEQGLPAIKTETFKGLLRQSCREWDSWCSQSGINAKSYYSFIYKFENTVSLDLSLFLDEARTPHVILQNPFIVHTFTAVNENGTAAGQSLHALECGAKGCVFNGKVSFLLKEKTDEAEAIVRYLENGLKNLKWMGGYRRRGLGSIQVDAIVSKIADISSNKSNSYNKLEIGLILQLCDDTCFGGTAQTGNFLGTRDYIPGTSILGMLRNVLPGISQGDNGKNTLPVYLDDNMVSATPFYPLPAAIQPAAIQQAPLIMPVPLSLRMVKKSDIYLHLDEQDQQAGLSHWVYKQRADDRLLSRVTQDTLIPGEKLRGTDSGSDKSFPGGYLYNDADIEKTIYYTAKTTINMRNTIEKESQVTKENSLFIQEQIEKGSCFMGTISFKNTLHLEQFMADFHGWLSGAYYLHTGKGGKPVKIIHHYFPEPFAAQSATGIALFDCTEKDANIRHPGFTITLVSDVVLYDAILNHKSYIDEEVIAELANHHSSHNTANNPLFAANDFTLVNNISETDVIQSFSGTAGLRRFSDLAIKRGSVFYFHYKGEQKATLEKALGNMQLTGIGERRNEGFGLIVINHPVHCSLNRIIAESEKTPIQFELEKPLHSEHTRQQLEMNHQIFCEAKIIADDWIKKNPDISNSLINGLISKMEAKIPLDKMNNLLDHYKQKTNSSPYVEFQMYLEKYYKKYNDIEKVYKILKLALEIVKSREPDYGK